MKPLIKYQGGKSREIPYIKTLISPFTGRFIEPFCGGASLAFFLERPAILNDISPLLMNLYRVIASDAYDTLQSQVDELRNYDRGGLEEIYYQARGVINHPQEYDLLTQAKSFLIVRQLCFSGMERYNQRGAFNVPFGHYQKFHCGLSKEHHDFLKICGLHNQDFIDIIQQATADDFIFLDPPYLARLGYSLGDGGEILHQKLHDALRQTPASWLLVHSDHVFYREYYADYIIYTQDKLYAQRFGKNKNHSNAQVTHLYILKK